MEDEFFIASTNEITFHFPIGSKMALKSFSIERQTKVGGELTWSIFLSINNENGSFTEFSNFYTAHLIDRNGEKKEISKSGILFSGNSYLSDDIINFQIEVERKPNVSEKMTDLGEPAFNLVLSSFFNNTITGRETLSVLVETEGEVSEKDVLFYEIKPCGDAPNEKETSDTAPIPCGDPRSGDCSKLKYIMVDKTKLFCSMEGSARGEIADGRSFKINLRNKNINGTQNDPPECYKLERLEGMPPAIKDTKECCNRMENPKETICTVSSSQIRPYADCAECNSSLNKSLKFKEECVAYLLARGWLADLGHQDTKLGKIEIALEHYDDGTPLEPEYTEYNVSATSGMVRRLLPNGASSSEKRMMTNVPLSFNKNVRMDESYLKYTINHSSEQSIMLVSRLRAQFLFEQPMVARVYGDGGGIKTLKRIHDIKGDKAFIQYLHTNKMSNLLNFKNGKHFSVGANYSYSLNSLTSPEAGSGKTSRTIEVKSFFEISDILELFTNAPTNETESQFKQRARSKIKVEMSASGSSAVKKPKNEMLNLIQQAYIAGQGPMGGLANLLLAIQNIRNQDSVVKSVGLSFERYFTNGSHLKAFSKTTSRTEKKGELSSNDFSKYPEDPNDPNKPIENYEYRINGIELKLEPLDGTVLSLIHHDDNGELELGINYTKEFKELGFLNDFANRLGDGEGAMTFYSGMSLITSANSGDENKRYGFNSGLSLSGKFQKRTNLAEDEKFKIFMSGFNYNLNASLREGPRGAVNWQKEKENILHQSDNSWIKLNYKLEAGLDGAFSKPHFDGKAEIDFLYQRRLFEFEGFLGSIELELRANAQAKLDNNSGSISQMALVSVIASAKLTWKNEFFSYFGFGFDIYPSVGVSFGFDFVGNTKIKMDGITGQKGPIALATVPFGAFSFDIVIPSEFDDFIRLRSTSFFTFLGEYAEEIPLAGFFLGTALRVIGGLPLISRLGKNESIFEYLIRLFYTKFYLNFLKAAYECEEEIVKRATTFAQPERLKIEENFRSLINSKPTSKEEAEEILKKNKEFLALPSVIGASLYEINSFFKSGVYSGISFYEHLEKKTNKDSRDSFINSLQTEKDKFIEEKMRSAIGKLYKDPRDCNCVSRLFKISQEDMKQVYIGAVKNFPQLGGDLGIIELFFEKMGNIYFSVLFKRLMNKEFKIKNINGEYYISHDLANNKGIKDEIIDGIKKLYSDEDVMFSKIIEDYPDFHKGKTGQTIASVLYILPLPDSQSEKTKKLQEAFNNTSKERVLGDIIRECYTFGGEENYCRSIFYEWIRFSKILGDTRNIRDENWNIKLLSSNNTNRTNLRDEGAKNRKTYDDWIRYMQDLFGTGKISTSKIISKKCECNKPYVSFYQDFSTVNPKEITEKMMFFGGDNIPGQDLEEAISSLSYVVNHIGDCMSASIPVPKWESVEKLGYYYNSPTSIIEPQKDVTYKGFNEPFSPNPHDIKIMASDFLSRMTVLKKNIGVFDSKETLSDWYIYLATKKSGTNDIGIFSNTPFQYKNPYTNSDIKVEEALDHFKNVRGLADRMKNLLKELAFTVINHDNSGQFKEFFYGIINDLRFLMRDVYEEKISVMNPGDLTGSEEEKLKKVLTLKFTLSLKETALAIIDKDLYIFAEILKQIVEAELNAERDGPLLSEAINDSRADIKSISDEIKKRLLYDNEENFDLEFLFDPSSLIRSLMPKNKKDGHRIPTAREASEHKAFNDNIGRHYFQYKNSKKPNVKAKEISSGSFSCSDEPVGKQLEYKALYKGVDRNSPHRSQYLVAKRFSGEVLKEVGQIGFSNEAYKKISNLFPYVLYSAIDTNRAATFSADGLGINTGGRFNYPCGIILLNGIHGEGNLK